MSLDLMDLGWVCLCRGAASSEQPLASLTYALFETPRTSRMTGGHTSRETGGPWLIIVRSLAGTNTADCPLIHTNHLGGDKTLENSSSVIYHCTL